MPILINVVFYNMIGHFPDLLSSSYALSLFVSVLAPMSAISWACNSVRILQLERFEYSCHSTHGVVYSGMMPDLCCCLSSTYSGHCSASLLWNCCWSKI